MQIPDEVRKCTAFLACKRKSGYENRGTVFFVAYPLDDCDGSGLLYAVTARHVIEKLQEPGDGKVYCRLTTKANGAQYVEIPEDQWVFNDDSRVDVAVAPVSIDRQIFDISFILLSMFVTPQVLTEQEVGIGDELFFPGLFVHHPGRLENLPILRTGNIAAMPSEPISTTAGVLPRAYLVEARSIGGLSGSPVFWYRGPTRITARTLSFGPGEFDLFYLLGLVHGHYETRDSAVDSSESMMVDSLGWRSINTGIAIAIPADDIRNTLDHPKLRAVREIERERILAMRKLSLPVPDAIGASTREAEVIAQFDTLPRTDHTIAVSEIDTSCDSEEDDADRKVTQ